MSNLLFLTKIIFSIFQLNIYPQFKEGLKMSIGRTAFFEISGEPAERGLEYGQKLKNKIKDTIDFFHRYNEYQGVSLKESRDIIAKFLPYIKEYSPTLERELQGIATGAGVNYADLIMISLNEERNIFNHGNNCTVFAATGNSTKNGQVIIGQTWDNFLEWTENFSDLLLIRRSKKDPDVISYSYPGMLAAAGLNSSQLAVCWNSVPRLNIKIGVPTYLIIAEILRQRSLKDALAVVLKAKRAGCFNLVISNKDEIYNLEATAEDIEVSHYSSHFCHTNHYLTARFACQEPEAKTPKEKKRKTSSIMRQKRMANLLDENSGQISPTISQMFLQDHFNHPQSICRHPESNSNYKDRLLTRAAWIIAPASKEIWYAGGPPCQNKFKKYQL